MAKSVFILMVAFLVSCATTENANQSKLDEPALAPEATKPTEKSVIKLNTKSLGSEPGSGND